jgi:hypothetical protein
MLGIFKSILNARSDFLRDEGVFIFTFIFVFDVEYNSSSKINTRKKIINFDVFIFYITTSKSL